MKPFLGALAVALTFALFLPYIRSIGRGAIRPHVFSWIIWGLGTLTVGFAQLCDGGGAGAIVIVISGAISCYIAWLSYCKRGETIVSATDWLFFGAALGAWPLWFFSSNPLWAVVTLTAVDLLGFGPTIRKAYARPHEESSGFFALSALRNSLVVLALENYSLTTVLFPAAVGAACLVLAVLLVLRQRIVAQTAEANAQR